MTTQAINDEKLHAFMMQIVGDMGAAAGALLTYAGDRLGLSKALDGVGPLTAEQMGGEDGGTRPLGAGVAERTGGIGIHNVRPGGSDLHAASRASDGPDERGQPGLHGGRQEMFNEAGFSRFRRATEMPFNLILEARP